MQFRIGDEPFYIRKVPHKDVVEVKISGKILLYDRSERSWLSEDDCPNEELILEIIEQHFIPGDKQNRHRTSYKGF